MVTDPQTLLSQFQQALASGNRGKVNETAIALIDAQVPLGRSWKAVATVLLQNGENASARRAMDVWSQSTGRTPHVEFERAAVLAKTGRLAEAKDIVEALPADVPDRAGHSYVLGTIATNLGDARTANLNLRKAIEADPRSGQAYLALAMTGSLADRKEDCLLIEEARIPMGNASDMERAAWLYALGKAHSDRENFDLAFEAYEEGARLRGRDIAYDRTQDRRNAEIAISGWSGKPAGPALPKPVRDPIFVTGLPRSGTTLVEQILASHSKVEGGGELGLLRLLEQDIGGASAAQLRRWLDQGNEPPDLVEAFDHLLNEAVPGRGRIIDKTLSTSRNMGMISAIFPSSPVIWLRRDPLDCAWSAYRTWFMRGLEWSWNLTDIAAHFTLEDELFEHWSKLLPDQVLEVEYARLVEDPQHEIARILVHCGLDNEATCFAPHQTVRPVTTASVSQVREPINRQGLNSAAPYRERLSPFTENYPN